MKPISNDLRKRLVKVYEEGQLSYAKVAERFQVSEGSVKNFVRQWRETGTIAPKPAANGKTFRIDEAGEELLTGLLADKTDLSQDELRGQLSQKTGCVVSQPTICRTLHRLQITRKKKSKRAEEQLRDDIKRARQDFQEVQEAVSGEKIIAVDEMGCVTGMSRTYGYAPRGERAVSYEPGGKGTRLSLIGALSTAGFLGGLELEGTVNGDVFEAFVEQILVPQLRPGAVVLWDNVSFHRRERLQELIEAHGATVQFLPAYSPEFNPIEECWSKIKAWLRKKAARTVETLQEAITEAIQQVTLKDIDGWFRHSGFKVNTNE